MRRERHRVRNRLTRRYGAERARYDRKLEDVLGLQEEIAHEIVAALETLLPCEPRAVASWASPRIPNRLQTGLSQVV